MLIVPEVFLGCGGGGGGGGATASLAFRRAPAREVDGTKYYTQEHVYIFRLFQWFCRSVVGRFVNSPYVVVFGR